MKNLIEKRSGSTHPYALGCSSWGASSESDVQQSSMSRGLTLKMGVLPQQCHKTKPLNLQYQDRDSSSSQSTGQSYPEVGSAQSGTSNIYLCFHLVMKSKIIAIYDYDVTVRSDILLRMLSACLV